MADVEQIAATRAAEQSDEAKPRRGGKRKFSDKELAAAMEDADGVQTKAAEILGVSKHTVFIRVKKLRDRGGVAPSPTMEQTPTERAAAELRKLSGEMYAAGSDRLASRLRDIAVRLEKP